MYLWTGDDRLYALFFPGIILALARTDDDIGTFGNTGNPISLLSKVVVVVVFVPPAQGPTYHLHYSFLTMSNEIIFVFCA
jgi:hypothetical protein